MLKKLLPLLLGLLIALCGLAACEETPNPGPGPDPQPSDPTFEVLSTLEFYNWNDTKDLVISYEGTGSVDSVSVGTTALRSSDYTAEDGVLIISQAALDSFVEGKYSLVIKSGGTAPKSWCSSSANRSKTEAATSADSPPAARTWISSLTRRRNRFGEERRRGAYRRSVLLRRGKL